jgi:hypothetical protein
LKVIKAQLSLIKWLKGINLPFFQTVEKIPDPALFSCWLSRLG